MSGFEVQIFQFSPQIRFWRVYIQIFPSHLAKYPKILFQIFLQLRRMGWARIAIAGGTTGAAAVQTPLWALLDGVPHFVTLSHFATVSTTKLWLVINDCGSIDFKFKFKIKILHLPSMRTMISLNYKLFFNTITILFLQFFSNCLKIWIIINN